MGTVMVEWLAEVAHDQEVEGLNPATSKGRWWNVTWFTVIHQLKFWNPFDWTVNGFPNFRFN